MYGLSSKLSLNLNTFLQLVGGFQAEAADKARETEATKLKLVELRKLISQLLRSINDVSLLYLPFLTPMI